jgi:hypothetical protein
MYFIAFLMGLVEGQTGMQSGRPLRFANQLVGYSGSRPIKTKKKGGSVSHIHHDAAPGLLLLLCERSYEAGRALESFFVGACSKLHRWFSAVYIELGSA